MRAIFFLQKGSQNVTRTRLIVFRSSKLASTKIFMILATLMVVLVFAHRARAHYHILTLDKPSIAKDETVTCTLRFGHPFEHQMFAAQKPTRVAVRLPDGTSHDL